jgi:hypothetical protein
MSEKAKLAKCSAQGIWGDSPYLEWGTGGADSVAKHATNLGVCHNDHRLHPGTQCPVSLQSSNGLCSTMWYDGAKTRCGYNILEYNHDNPSLHWPVMMRYQLSVSRDYMAAQWFPGGGEQPSNTKLKTSREKDCIYIPRTLLEAQWEVPIRMAEHHKGQKHTKRTCTLPGGMHSMPESLTTVKKPESKSYCCCHHRWLGPWTMTWGQFCRKCKLDSIQRGKTLLTAVPRTKLMVFSGTLW